MGLGSERAQGEGWEAALGSAIMPGDHRDSRSAPEGAAPIAAPPFGGAPGDRISRQPGGSPCLGR